MDYKQEMVKRLKGDCKELIERKIPKALQNIDSLNGTGINTYRNLTKALAENVKLIEECEDGFKPMWSIYKTGVDGDKPKPQVAVWMQNGKGEISSHQVFDIDYGIKGGTISGCTVNYECDKQDSFYKEWENRFLKEHMMGLPSTVFTITNMVRNIGKTTFLLNQAKKNNGVYLSMRSRACRVFNDGKVTCGMVGFEDIKRYKKDTKMYVDECVSDEIVKYIEDNFNEYFIFRCVN